eukprot:TRINITY_DN6196_c0_g1_i4.p1 TRINITY_DN6196_c0_g1~~TRINITY_DN6196_c0_g1_i4.p1  ORF type:complete len:302 (+),score=73.43 TRINITY_DN6196_c0_g1_i4:131-1036(+)
MEDRKAKTHKGRKILEKRRGLINEEPKNILLLKGNKTNEVVTNCMKELQKWCGFNCKNMMGRKHEVKPFEDAAHLEKFCETNDASLFILGNHTKKRPQNLTIGRLYNSKVLDMVELGIESMKSMTEFPNKGNFGLGLKPVIIFQGERFEYSDEYIKIRNLLADLFRLQDSERFDITQTKKIMVFTVLGEKAISLRCFTSNLPSAYEVSEDPEPSNGQVVSKEPLVEIGPSVRFIVRRTYLSSEDAFKESLKKPKVIEKQKKKKDNIEHNELGQVLGRLHVQQQDLSTLVLKHVKVSLYKCW